LALLLGVTLSLVPPTQCLAAETASTATTYTLAQILSAQEANWNRLRDVHFMAVRLQSGMSGAPRGTDSSPSARPIAGPRPAPAPPTKSPSRDERPTPVLGQEQSSPSSSTKHALPVSREILIIGMADSENQRSVALVLPGAAGAIYRRRMGDVEWRPGVMATVSSGKLGKLAHLSVENSSSDSTNNRIPTIREEALHEDENAKLQGPAYVRNAAFHPRHLTDLDWLYEAWRNGSGVIIERVSQGRIQVRLVKDGVTHEAVLLEESSLLPERVLHWKAGVLVERRTLLLREIAGVSIGARMLLERPGGYQESWHYDRYAANQGLPSRGISAEFLNLPSSVELPAWLRPPRPGAQDPPVPFSYSN
jgi:hypothetical protein